MWYKYIQNKYHQLINNSRNNQQISPFNNTRAYHHMQQLLSYDLYKCLQHLIIQIKIMLQKARVYPQFTYPPQKFTFDPFHNPYLPKLVIKLTPKPSLTPNTFLSPLNPSHNLYISQALPLYKSQKTRVALIWKTYLTHKFARSHFGLSFQYKLYESIRLKTKVMGGSSGLIDVELSKFISKDVQVFTGYSGVGQSNHVYHSLLLGVRKGNFVASVNKKIDSSAQLRLSFTKQIQKQLYLQSSFNSSTYNLKNGQLQLNLRQNIGDKIWAGLGLVLTPYYKQVGVKVQLEGSITKHQKLVVSSEWLDGKSVIYLGFKNLTFNFIFPVFVTESAIPVIAGVCGYIGAYLFKGRFIKKNKSKQKNDDKQQKTQSNRLQQLKVINDKSTDQYEKQKNSQRGLCIQQAFLGPSSEIRQFMNDPQRHIIYYRDEQIKKRYVDLTVTMRFYVMKGQLKLRKGSKTNLLGFYQHHPQADCIAIRYTNKKKTQIAFFQIQEPIYLPQIM